MSPCSVPRVCTLFVRFASMLCCCCCTTLTLKRLSCSTFLMATTSPDASTVAWNTTPKLPLPTTCSAQYVTPFALMVILSSSRRDELDEPGAARHNKRERTQEPRWAKQQQQQREKERAVREQA